MGRTSDTGPKKPFFRKIPRIFEAREWKFRIYKITSVYQTIVFYFFKVLKVNSWAHSGPFIKTLKNVSQPTKCRISNVYKYFSVARKNCSYLIEPIIKLGPSSRNICKKLSEIVKNAKKLVLIAPTIFLHPLNDKISKIGSINRF